MQCFSYFVTYFQTDQKMHQNHSVALPGPAGSLHRSPADPLAGFWEEGWGKWEKGRGEGTEKEEEVRRMRGIAPILEPL